MRQNPKFLADLVTFTEELLHAKLDFLFSENDSNYARELIKLVSVSYEISVAEVTATSII